MGREEERARRAREAYEKAQRDATVHAQQEASEKAAAERVRVARNVDLLSRSLSAAITRLETAEFPGVEMVLVGDKEVRRSLFGRPEIEPITEPGWKLYLCVSRYEGPNVLIHESQIYLLADGSLFEYWSDTSDSDSMGASVRGENKISLQELAGFEQKHVDGVLAALDALSKPTGEM